MTSKFILALIVLVFTLTSGPAPAQDYFKGKTITLVVGTQPGGTNPEGSNHADHGQVPLPGIYFGCGGIPPFSSKIYLEEKKFPHN